METKWISVSSTAAEIASTLRLAADIILRDGYISGTRHSNHRNNSGAVCAIGAIERAKGMAAAWNAEYYCQPEMEALVKMIPETVAPVYSGVECKIAEWNNNHSSAEEVACLMRAAAELVEEERR